MKAIGGHLWLSVAFSMLAAVASAAGLEPPSSLIASLCAEDFKTREVAQSALSDWALSHWPEGAEALFQLHSQHPDPEVRERSLRAMRVLSDHHYSRSGKGFVGIRMLEREAVLADPDDHQNLGVIVVEVVPNSPAAIAGLVVGDLIVTLDGLPWQQKDVMGQFQQEIQKRAPGTEVTLAIIRNDEPLDLKLILGRMPDAVENQALRLDRGTDMHLLEEKSRQRYFSVWLDEKPWRLR